MIVMKEGRKEGRVRYGQIEEMRKVKREEKEKRDEDAVFPSSSLPFSFFISILTYCLQIHFFISFLSHHLFFLTVRYSSNHSLNRNGMLSREMRRGMVGNKVWMEGWECMYEVVSNCRA